MSRILSAGEAWFGAAGTGSVCGVFTKAAYVRVGGQLLALVGPSVPNGPLHLRLSRVPPLRVGDGIALEADRLVVGDLRERIDRAHMWIPPKLDLAGRAGARAASGPPPDIGLASADLDAAGCAVLTGDLPAAAALLGGRGPGLTPSGDDVLAGVLVVDALTDPGGGERRRHLVAAVRTTDLATAFLRWAAAGQSIEPLHDLLGAVAARSPPAVRAARAKLVAVGASSGAALAWGLDLALARPHDAVAR